MTERAKDWLIFFAGVLALSTLHLAAAAGAGLLRGADPTEGAVFYAAKGWLAPLVALVCVSVAQIVSRFRSSAWIDRPGRLAWKVMLPLGLIVIAFASEVRALLA